MDAKGRRIQKLLRNYAKNVVPEGTTCTHLVEEDTIFKFKSALGRDYSKTFMVKNVSIPIGGGIDRHNIQFDRPYCEQCAIWIAEKWLSEPFDQDHFDKIEGSYHFDFTFGDAAKVFQCRGDCFLICRHLHTALVDEYFVFNLQVCICGMVTEAFGKCDCDGRDCVDDGEYFKLRLAKFMAEQEPEHIEIEM